MSWSVDVSIGFVDPLCWYGGEYFGEFMVNSEGRGDDSFGVVEVVGTD